MPVVLNSQHLQLDSMSRNLHDNLETEIKATLLSRIGSCDDFLEELNRGLAGKFNFYYGENLWGLNFKKDLDNKVRT